MTQILVTLDSGADAGFLQRMIENMKGVLTTKLSRSTEVKPAKEVTHKIEDNEWFDRLETLRRSYDRSYIDMNDERTRYILEK